MLLKNYKICRSQENSSLSFLNHHLYMVQTQRNNHPVYLSTFDMQTGLIHDGTTLFDHIIIKHHFHNQFSFFSKRLKSYYYSSPISEQQDKTLFQTHPLKNYQWKKFEIQNLPDLQFNKNQFYQLTQQTLNNTINLYWWRNKSFTNIGDELNLYIVGHLSKKNICRTSFKNTDLIAIGSILNWAIPRNRVYSVWGSGTLTPQPLSNNLFKLSLLRGPLTHETFFNSTGKIPYGDPGLICDRIFNRYKTKPYDWGLIIHFSQYKKSWVQQILNNTPNIRFIDVTNPDVNEFMQQLTSCKKIASSSLHGLVIADSYHIPNIWLWDHNLHEGGKWKFFDYFAGIRRTEINSFNPVHIKNLNHVSLDHLNLSYFDNLEKIKNRIIDCFPL